MRPTNRLYCGFSCVADLVLDLISALARALIAGVRVSPIYTRFFRGPVAPPHGFPTRPVASRGIPTVPDLSPRKL